MKSCREKGKNIIDFPEKYTVIDIETTGLDPSFDSIIEVAAIKFENGVEVGRFSELIKPSSYYILDEEDIESEKDYVFIDGNPGKYIDGFITALTGITNEMLDGAREETGVLADYINFIGDDILVGHNVNFDINFLYDAIENHFNKKLDNDFVDNMRIARKHLKQLEHHRQSDIVEHYGIAYSKAHRALADCIMCNACHEKLKEDVLSKYGCIAAFSELFKRKYSSGNSYKVRAKDITANVEEINPDNALYGKVFVFTGTLDRMARKEAMQIVVNFGGINGDSVTKKTNYLVLGTQDYKVTKGGKSSKMKKAEKLKLEGNDIQIISENVFYDMVDEEMQAMESTECPEKNRAEVSNWKNDVKTMLEILAEDMELPEGSLYLYSNIGKKSKKVTSYSICIYEPEYPPIPNAKKDEKRNSVVLRIEEKTETEVELTLGRVQYESINTPETAEINIRQSEPDTVRMKFDASDPAFIEYLKENTIYRIRNYSSKESSFGCCSRYEMCSDAKKCVHENKLFACACQYKRNLESGRIFYGKNKNVDQNGKLII